MAELIVKGITQKKLRELRHAVLNENGHELVNPEQIEMPAGVNAPMTLDQRIARVLRNDFSQQAMEQGEESFEEANDFDCDEDREFEDMNTQYTLLEEEYIEPNIDQNISQPNIDTNVEGTPTASSGEGSGNTGDTAGDVSQVDNGISQEAAT